MSNAIIVEEIRRSLVVKFNRPELRNPLSIEVLESLSLVVSRAEETVNFDSLIFTGSDGVFASGADLRQIAEVAGGDEAREFALRGQSLMTRIAELRCETIAAINGICFGGALDLALSCDRRVASPDAVFSHPGANLGIITGWGGTQKLPRLTGEAKALEMFFTAKRVNAAGSVVDRAHLSDRRRSAWLCIELT
jgi:enoyl-CoA hydratase/carnithine racemase